MTKVIERTSNMLDTPPQDKLYRRLPVFNACEHSWIMMIMGGSKMSKPEYGTFTSFQRLWALLNNDDNGRQ